MIETEMILRTTSMFYSLQSYKAIPYLLIRCSRMIEAIDNACFVCCFLNANYEESPFCKLELEYAKKLKKGIASCILVDKHQWRPTKSKWLDLAIRSTQLFDFSSSSEEFLMRQLQQLILIIDYGLLDSQENFLKPKDKLVIALKHQYLCRGQIKRTSDETMNFAMEKMYVNLSMVITKQEAVEKTLLRQNQSSPNIKDVLKLCENKRKRVVLRGPTGIGKSTFCEYATYLWAKGDLWSEYDLVVLIRLEELTKIRYPRDGNYMPIDLIENEYLGPDRSSYKESEALRKMCEEDENILWILDGYDGFSRHAPEQTKHAFNKIIDRHNFLLTSRLYPINLWYDNSFEMTGFADKDLENYIGQYFQQCNDQVPKLIRFVKSNPNVWAIAQTPVNLKLLCMMWTDINWSNRPNITITYLYEQFVNFLCKQCLKKANIDYDFNDNQKIDEHCGKELRFLENLAFVAMESSSYIIQFDLLKKVAEDLQFEPFSNPKLFNLSILKLSSYHYDTYYFVHSTLQDYFAARYLARQLRIDKQSAIKFINARKYEQRFTKLFVFTTGILVSQSDLQLLDLFISTIEGQPTDIIGMCHIQLIIQLFDELEPCKNYQNLQKHLHQIHNWFQFAIKQTNKTIQSNVVNTIANSATLSRLTHFRETLMSTQCQGIDIQTQDTNDAHFDMNIVHQLTDSKWFHRLNAYETIVRMCEKAATKDTLLELINLFQNPDKDVRNIACYTLIKISDKAIPDDLISTFLLALQHSQWLVKKTACSAIRHIANKITTNDIIHLLIKLLGDSDKRVQHTACETLISIGHKAANTQTIGVLTELLKDGQWSVKEAACTVLTAMGDHIHTAETIDALITVVCTEKGILRATACRALGNICRNRVNYYLVDQLLQTLRHSQHDVRQAACQVLDSIGSRIARKNVIEALSQALNDKQCNVRAAACKTLKTFGDKAATDPVVSALIPILSDQEEDARQAAHATLINMPAEIATEYNIGAIISRMHYNYRDRRNIAQQTLTAMYSKAISKYDFSIILSALRSNNADVTYAICDALAYTDSNVATADVIEALIQILKRSENTYESIASDALVTMCSIARPTRERPISYMYVQRREPHYSLIIHALKEIFKYRTRSHSRTMTNLINMALEHSDDDLRYTACNYIIHAHLHETDERTVSLLLGLLKNSRNRLDEVVWGALKEISCYHSTNEFLDVIVESLKDFDDYTNRAVFEIIIQANEQLATKEIIKALTRILRDAQPRLKEYASKALAAMGSKAATEDIVYTLNQAVRDSQSYVRKAACQALAAISNEKATQATVDTFLYVLRLPECNFKIIALQGLTATGVNGTNKEIIDAIIEAMQNPDKEFMSAACKVLIATGDEPTIKTTIDILIQKYKDDNYGVRTCASGILVELAEKKLLNNFMDVFIEAMQDRDRSVKTTAFKVLTKMNYESAVTSIVSAAVQAMQESDENIKISACELIAIMAEKEVTAELINQLLRVYSNSNWKMKSISHKAFKKLGEIETRNDTINIIVQALSSSEKAMRRAACEALTQMRHNARVKHVIDALFETLKDSEASVRRVAWQALAKIEDWPIRDNAMEIAMQAMRDEDRDVKEVACQILTQMGANAATKDTMDTVMDLVSKSSYGTKRTACDTLLTLWTHMPTEDTLDVLIGILQGGDDEFKCTACKALKTVINRPMDKKLIDLLIKMMSSPKDDALFSRKDDMKKAAVEIFESLDENVVTTDTINALLDALQDSTDRIRYAFRDALIGIFKKTTNQHVIVAILRGLRSSDEQVRELVENIFRWTYNKPASSGAINAIVEVFRDSDEKIRPIMHEAFLRMKISATTKDFTDSIIQVLRDPDQDVRQLAYERLLDMNEQMVTKDLVDMLIEIMQHADWPVRQAVAEIFDRWKFVKFDSDQINNILSSTGHVNETSLRALFMSQSLWNNISEDHVVKLKNCVFSKPFFAFENIPADKLMQIWLADSRTEWIPLLVHFALIHRTAIVRAEKDLILYNVHNEAIRQSVDEQKLSCFLQSVRQLSPQENENLNTQN